MNAPFAATADALREIALWERHRIELMQWLAVRGHTEPPPALAFAGWRERLVLIEGGVEIFTLLIPHEAAVRALDPALCRA